jgi:hypothetical protein
MFAKAKYTYMTAKHPGRRPYIISEFGVAPTGRHRTARTTEGILINCEDFERVELHDVLGRHEIWYEHRVSTNLKGLWYVRVFNKAGMTYFFKVVL